MHDLNLDAEFYVHLLERYKTVNGKESCTTYMKGDDKYE